MKHLILAAAFVITTTASAAAMPLPQTSTLPVENSAIIKLADSTSKAECEKIFASLQKNVSAYNVKFEKAKSSGLSDEQAEAKLSSEKQSIENETAGFETKCILPS